MRKYLICYYTERNDTCTDLEDIVHAESLEEALEQFTSSKVYRRITSIVELSDNTIIEQFKRTENARYFDVLKRKLPV